jgi:hypothetical protein
MAGDNEIVRVELNRGDLGRLMHEVKEFDPRLSTALRRRMRNAGKLVMGDVKADILSYPGSVQTGMREELAASLAVRIQNTKHKQAVKIVSTGAKLPAQKKVLARAMNASSIRHPVFGRGGWAQQPGMRFFSKSVIDKHKPQAIEEIRLALEEAIAGMRGR